MTFRSRRKQIIIKDGFQSQNPLDQELIPSKPVSISCTGATITHPHTNKIYADNEILDAIRTHGGKLTASEKNRLAELRIQLSKGDFISESAIYFIFRSMDKMHRDISSKRSAESEEIFNKTKLLFNLKRNPDDVTNQMKFFGEKVIVKLKTQLANFFKRGDMKEYVSHHLGIPIIDRQRNTKTNSISKAINSMSLESKIDEIISCAVKVIVENIFSNAMVSCPGSSKKLFKRTMSYFGNPALAEDFSSNLADFPKHLKGTLNKLSEQGMRQEERDKLLIPYALDRLTGRNEGVEEIASGAIGSSANHKSRGLGRKYQHVPKPVAEDSEN